MIVRRWFVFAALASAGVSRVAIGQTSADGGAPRVTDAWSRPALKGRTGAVYLTIRAGSRDDRLLALKTSAAAEAELHRSMDDHGVMRMRPAGPLAVGTGQVVRLEPGGYHVMLMGLTRDLTPGESFPVTLVFEAAGEVTATATVRKGRAPADDMGGMPMMPMGQPAGR